MALRGDDEMFSLLDLMGGQTAPLSATSSSSAKPPSPVKKLLKSDGKPKSKKRGGERRHKMTTTRNQGGKGDDGSSETQRMSFADSRMIQNCSVWPCSDDDIRVLTLGSGLLHNCAGYICGPNDEHGQSELYGSSTCQSCGKSAATHELCISSSWTTDERTPNPLSFISVASIVVASRNLRCVIGEYYPESSVETQKGGTRIQNKDMLPPLNAIPCSSETIPNAVDVYLGRILSAVKKMQNDMASTSKSRYKIRQSGDVKIDSFASIPIVSDFSILQENISALTKSVQEYKSAVAASSNGDNNAAAINLVESRLVAMASCDSVYYRCYYDAVSSCVSTDVACDGSLVAAIIPHPPTYFSCPGLAWDAQNGGVESLRVYMGKCSDKAFLTAPLDESFKQSLLKSWGLEDRLSAVKLGGLATNPLLALWQSRFMETIRHVWCTQYSAAKSSIALNEASDVKVLSNHSEDTQLILHQANALSPELSQWRDSIRDYPAHFYAYAAPTTEALNSISKCLKRSSIDQVLEAGAGTGYWSALLLRHLKGYAKDNEEENVRTMHTSAQVVPYDVAPPSSDVNGDGSCNAAMSNEYHGHVPAFMHILEAASFEQALSSTSKSSAKTALLLCYPPPGNDMAQKALFAHMSNGGHTVIHIGEWQGLTGDKSFEALLQQNFFCRETDVVSLPLWGTDATYLTIWRRKGYSAFENGVISYSAAMGHCSVQDCRNHARRRCRYARLLQYCSFDCYEKHRVIRRAMLAIHMVRTEFGDAVYEDDRHFMALNDPFESGKMKRKKRKRSRH